MQNHKKHLNKKQKLNLKQKAPIKLFQSFTLLLHNVIDHNQQRKKKNLQYRKARLTDFFGVNRDTFLFSCILFTEKREFFHFVCLILSFLCILFIYNYLIFAGTTFLPNKWIFIFFFVCKDLNVFFCPVLCTLLLNTEKQTMIVMRGLCFVGELRVLWSINLTNDLGIYLNFLISVVFPFKSGCVGRLLLIF